MGNFFNDHGKPRSFIPKAAIDADFQWHKYVEMDRAKHAEFSLGLGSMTPTPAYQPYRAENAGAIWTLEDRLQILKMLERNISPYDIAIRLGRSLYSIFCQLQHLGILSKGIEYNERRFGSITARVPQERMEEAWRRVYTPHAEFEKHKKHPNQPKEQDMSKVNANHILSLMQENFTTVKVSFPSDGRQYTYKARNETALKVGDFCVVFARGRYKIVEVKAIDLVPDINLEADYEYDWIVQKVDTTEYLATQEKEKKFIDTFLAIEKEKRRQEAVADFKKYLPEGTEGNRMLTQAIEDLNKPAA